MDSIIAFVVSSIVGIVFLFIGDSIGKTAVEKKLLESCEKHGIYIIEGAAIQCPAVIKTK